MWAITVRRVAVLLAASSVAMGCSRPSAVIHDELVLNGPDQATVMLWGRRASGCVEAETYVGSVLLPIQNVLPSKGCRSMMAILAPGHALNVVTDPSRLSWSDAADQIPAALGDAPIALSVRVFVVNRGTTREFQEFATGAKTALQRAAILFDNAGCGLDLQWSGEVTPAPMFPEEQERDACKILRWYQDAVVGGSDINVIYGANLASRGDYCSDLPHTVGIGHGADQETLAHEIGHALSLMHDVPSDHNVMFSGGEGRTFFSPGQCFQTSVNSASLVYRRPTTSDAINCPSSPDCPSRVCLNCWRGERAAPIPTEPEPLVDAFLLCDDQCGELERALAQSPSVPEVISILRNRLMNGAPERQINALTDPLITVAEGKRFEAQRGGPRLDLDPAVIRSHFRGNLDTAVRSRATAALEVFSARGQRAAADALQGARAALRVAGSSLATARIEVQRMLRRQ